MEHQEVVARLRSLREGIEQNGEVRIAALEAPFALALSDVCCALGLTEEEHDEVLGWDAAAYVVGICRAQFWPVEIVVNKETATVALPEVVAVPA